MPFSLDDLEATGEPFLVVANGHDGTVSSDGTLAYVRGSTSAIPESQLAWVDRSGVEISPIGQPHTLLPILDLSPDDTRLVVDTSDDDQIDLWIHDLERGTRTRLTFEGGAQPIWSPDGENIVFTRREEGEVILYIKRADGTDDRRLLTQGFFPTLSPDGKWLLFNRFQGGNYSILRLGLENPETEPVVVLENAMRARFSPDGNFVAYTSNDGDGQPPQVMLTRFPEITGRWQISTETGGFAHWRADGRELFYLNGTNNIMATSISFGPPVRVGTPTLLFRRQPTGIPMPFDLPDRFAVSSDGQRFVIATRDAGKAIGAPPITVVTNWFEEFREDGR